MERAWSLARMAISLAVDWSSIFWPSIGIAEVIVRGSLMYVALFVTLRIVGRRQSGRFGTADLLVIVLIADAAQNALGKDYQSVTEGVVLVLTIVAWEYAIDWLAWRYPTLRPWLRTDALQLVAGGKILSANMEREMLSDDELRAALREHGLEDMRRVKDIYIEQSGHFSIIRIDKQ
jgi:uncharacterized membrane protein YcaP (DUF421 family)